MNVSEQIKAIVTNLDIIDTYYEELPVKQSQVDMAISDLYHYIENNSMSTKSSYRMVKELKGRLLERRKFKQEYELLKVYNVQKDKLLQIDNRKMLLAQIGKVEKQLSYPYKNRIYDDEELRKQLNE